MESEDIKMYICVECGRIMEDYSSWTEPHGEDMCGCPHCGGEVEEAQECAICGEYHLEEDLTNGVCECCAREEIDFSSAFRYLTKTNRLRDFFLVWLWGIVESVDTEKECKEIDRTLMAVFRHEEAKDPENFKKTLQEYILEDIYDWTEFLEKEVNANENAKG
jgi:DNA-directed RNA polymerase subunit RPC12/RpoP